VLNFEFSQPLMHLDVDENPPIKMKTARWIYIHDSPDGSYCKGDWRYRKPFTYWDFVSTWSKMNDPIVI